MSIRRFIACAALSFILIPSSALAQQVGDEAPRQLTPKEEKKRLEKLRKELAGPFKRWLREDVSYIITGEERKVFLNLSTDEERENFIEQFWLRRDPTPDTEENEYREEHYRRIQYANERYASGIPGWRTDRGRTYITFGPPDENESHPSGGTYQRPYEEGGGTTSTFPFEIWRYRYLEGVGTDVLIEFVDPTMTGEYRMTIDPSEKDALLHVPGAGLTLAEEMGLSTKADRFSRTDGTRMAEPVGGGAQSRRYNMFERLEQMANLQRPPQIKFKDLEAVVDSTIEYNTLPYTVDVQYVRITSDNVLTGITVQLQNKDLVFREEDGLQKGIVNIYGRITTVTRRLAKVFEDPVTITTTADRLADEMDRASIYQQAVPLAPGMYRLELVVKDIVGETMSTYRTALNVPGYDDDKLASSSLILADKIERVPTRSLGTGQFVIGSSKVRPRINDEFKQNERLGIYMQVYNLGEDEQTNQMKGTISYQVAKLDKPDELLLDFTEDISEIRGGSPRQVVIEKLLPLQTLDPGKYRLSLKVTDGVKQETLNPSATFTVR
jgi:GWxTD domain-containing protein